jgi:golgi apyrase
MGAKNKWQYGVVLDAGSSGTRIHIYRWLPNSRAVQEADDVQLHALPEIDTHDNWTKKVHPGVSTFGETPTLVGPDHLEPLVQHALNHIPKEAVPSTPIFLLATAGVRLLPDRQRDALLDQICSYLQSRTNFLLSDCNAQVQVIPGTTEGLYGWIAANYLLGGFDSPEEHRHGKGHHTYGFLDMGGASAQIAFAPNATEATKHGNDLTLLRLRDIDGMSEEYRVFVTTWLGFGVNEARKRYVEALTSSYWSSHPGEAGSFVEMPDPCLPSGLRLTIGGQMLNSASAEESHLVGTGKFDECVRRAYPLLEKDVPCLDEPCLLNGVHVPAIDFDVNHFIGVSEYWHTTHEIFEMAHTDKAYDFNTYQNRVKEFCEQDWSSIEQGIEDMTWGKKVDEQTASEVCFKASWLITVLHDGIGIPRVGIDNTSTGAHDGTKAGLESGEEMGYLKPFQAVNKIKSTEISWTLGKILLYASSDIPAAEGALPVGFGSNEPGIPADFHYPGGGGRLATISDTDGQSLTDTIFSSDSSHRIPGFLFFFLIILIGCFYLCGRERRSRFVNSIFGPSRRKGRGWATYIPFLSSAHTINYERVLEDGHDDLDDPAEFELGDLGADDNNDLGRNGTAAGWDSPRRTPQLGLLSPEALDREGLAVRTESRERLDLAGGGRKSPKQK